MSKAHNSRGSASRRDVAEPETVQIEIVGNVATVTPAWQELLTPLLRFSSLCFQSGGRLGFRSSREVDRFWHVDEEGRLWIPAGFVPTAVVELRRVGCQVIVEDH